MPRRPQAEYSVLQADFFVISGMQGLKKILRARASRETARCAASPSSTTRRWKASWSRWWRDVERVRAVPGGRHGARRPPRRKVEYGSGVVGRPPATSSPTAALLEGCYVIACRGIGSAERVAAEDKRASSRCCASMARATSSRSALIGDARERHRRDAASASPIRRRRAAAARSAPRKARAGAMALALEPAPALGFAGAAALDAQGRLAGMAVLKSGGRRHGARRARERGAGAGRGDPRFPRGAERRAGRRPAAGIEAAKGSWCG